MFLDYACYSEWPKVADAVIEALFSIGKLEIASDAFSQQLTCHEFLTEVSGSQLVLAFTLDRETGKILVVRDGPGSRDIDTRGVGGDHKWPPRTRSLMEGTQLPHHVLHVFALGEGRLGLANARHAVADSLSLQGRRISDRKRVEDCCTGRHIQYVGLVCAWSGTMQHYRSRVRK
jgi:hypothetical protein